MQKFLVRAILSILFISLIFGGLSFNASARPLGAVSPVLGMSVNYSVLGATTVTNTGPTTILRNVGVSPGTAITGFPPGSVIGTSYGLHSNDASAIAAQADNLVVFGALDQACDQTFGAVELSTTFPGGVDPGVYCSTSSFSLTGNLQINDPAGVYIFKTASTLITSSGASVTGGNPCDIWWRVGSSATLGTNTSFKGNIFALTDISLQTGATLDGRALVQTGQVTLDNNVITGPICVLPAVPTNTPIGGPTNTPGGPTNTPVVPGLPGSGGGAPIQSDGFPLGLAILGGFSLLALAFGIRTYRGTWRPKQ